MESILHNVQVLGQRSTHGYEYSLDAQRQARPLWEGVAVGIDHQDGPRWAGESFGILRNPRVEADGTFGDLYFSSTHQLAPRIVEDIQRRMGIYGLSIVGKRYEQSGDLITAFVPVALDLVVKPACALPLAATAWLEQAPAVRFEQAQNQAQNQARNGEPPFIPKRFWAESQSTELFWFWKEAPETGMKTFWGSPETPAPRPSVKTHYE